MRILHTSDWHLGKKLEGHTRLPEQIDFLEELCALCDAQQIDALLVAGDLFDTFNPPADAVEVFYRYLKRLGNNGKRAIIAIAGNHDSPERIDAPDPLARECGIIFQGYPNTTSNLLEIEKGIKIVKSDAGFIELQLPDCEENLRIISTPYASEYRLKTYLESEDNEAELRDLLQAHWQEVADKYCDEKGVNVLCTHLFMMKKGGVQQEEPEDEKPILHIGGAQAVFTENLPKQLQYVALGHLHRYQQVDANPCPVVYSGSPLSYSFAEANQQKYVAVLNCKAGEAVEIEKHEIRSGKPLLRAKFEDIDEALAWLHEHSEAWVEFSIKTESFLTAKERKQFQEVHEGIITIIPELEKQLEEGEVKESKIDLNQNIQDLFSDYFQSKHGIVPSESHMSIFQEILAKKR